MNDMLDLIIECNDSELPEDICDIQYKLPLIGCVAVKIKAKDIDKLRQTTNIKAVHIIPHITAQMDNARKTINADDINYSGKGITIAFLDTGISPSEDFGKRILVFRDFVNGNDKPYDDNGHGTHVTGIACGNGRLSNGKYRGIAPEANIVSLKTLNNEGKGSASDILAGMQWIYDNKEKYNIRIVNLSIGTVASSSDDPLVKAAEVLWDSGISVVTAAGNNGPSPGSISSPGISRKVITVGSNDDEAEADIWGASLKNFSGRGPTPDCIIKPDILAPGRSIASCLASPSSGNYYQRLSGTSMSTPMVSGAIADLLEKNPSLTPDDVKYMLKLSCVKLGYPSNREGWGLLNVSSLLSREEFYVRT